MTPTLLSNLKSTLIILLSRRLILWRDVIRFILIKIISIRQLMHHINQQNKKVKVFPRPQATMEITHTHADYMVLGSQKIVLTPSTTGKRKKKSKNTLNLTKMKKVKHQLNGKVSRKSSNQRCTPFFRIHLLPTMLILKEGFLKLAMPPFLKLMVKFSCLIGLWWKVSQISASSGDTQKPAQLW